MVALLQPLANQRIAGTQHEEGNRNGDEDEVEHGSLLFESVNIFMWA
jgi:hypothetical protein